MSDASCLLYLDSDLVTLEVSGRDRASWLNGLVTQDIAKLDAGRGAYALVCGRNGKILAEAWIFADRDRMLVGLRRDRFALVRELFDKHLIMEDAELAEVERAWMFLEGPRSTDLVATARASGSLAASLDLSGFGGAVIVAPPEAVGVLRSSLLAEGALLASCEEWDARRIRRGLPRWSVDFGEDNYPQEASLERIAVSFDKGCYLGQEVVCMLELRGHVKSKLVRLVVDAPVEDMALGATIATDEGVDVGTITSLTQGETEASSIALGFVKYKHHEAGTKLRIGAFPARVEPAR